jgi:hypothetical protein
MLRLRRKVQQPPALLAPPYLGRRATDHGETVTDFARSGMHRCHSLVRLSSWFVRLCVKSGHFVTSGHVWRRALNRCRDSRCAGVPVGGVGAS